MTTDAKPTSESPVTNYDIGVPSWIDQDISLDDIRNILQGGCASGAYMPSVTYHQALATMGKHGDDVLQYIEDSLGELPDVSGESWSGMACKYLSCAVELWCASVQDETESALQELEGVQS